VDAQQDFVAVGSYDDTSTHNITDAVTWNSSDTNVATIVSGGATAGKATAKQVGSTTITASLDNVTSNNATLSVVDKTLQSITVTPTGVTLTSGNSQQFTATGHYGDGSDAVITASVDWSFTDDAPAYDVVVVGNTGGGKGLVTGLGPGTASIIATQGSISGNVSVTVVSP
jgi:hypothetical protein